MLVSCEEFIKPVSRDNYNIDTIVYNIFKYNIDKHGIHNCFSGDTTFGKVTLTGIAYKGEANAIREAEAPSENAAERNLY